MRRLLVGAIVANVIGLGCAHQRHPTAERELQIVAGRVAEWPRCSGAHGAVSVEQALAAGSRSAVRVRGLMVRTGEACTKMLCPESSGKNAACCNTCQGSWGISAQPGPDARPVVSLAPAGSAEPLGWSAMDCAVPELDDGARGVELIVSGTVREEQDASPEGVRLLSYSSVCVLRNDLAARVKGRGPARPRP